MSDRGMSAVGGDAARKLVLSACTVGGVARRPPAAGGDSRSAGAGGTGDSEKLDSGEVDRYSTELAGDDAGIGVSA